jgi:hyperosmotically inducible periplasmic protein
MKKIILLLVGSVLMFGAVSCDSVSKTSADAPANTDQSAAAPNSQTAQETQNDATNDTRKAQIESDIRAREQRSNITGGDTDRANGDLQSQVRGKLEANLPASQLTVDAKDGVVTVSGTVPTQAQLNKVQPLAMEIKGVKRVMNKVAIAPAKTN